MLYALSYGLLDVYWSKELLAEIEQTILKRYSKKHGIDASKESSFVVELMELYFPDSLSTFSDDDVALLDGIKLHDPNDIHVMALAHAVAADVICTHDRRDFPKQAMERVGVERWRFGKLLNYLISRFPDEMALVHQKVIKGKVEQSILDILRKDLHASDAADWFAELSA